MISRAAQEKLKGTIKWPPPLFAVRGDTFGLEHAGEPNTDPHEKGDELVPLPGRPAPGINNALRQRHLKYNGYYNEAMLLAGTPRDAEGSERGVRPLDADMMKFMGVADFVGTAEEVQAARALAKQNEDMLPDIKTEGWLRDRNMKTPESTFSWATAEHVAKVGS